MHFKWHSNEIKEQSADLTWEYYWPIVCAKSENHGIIRWTKHSSSLEGKFSRDYDILMHGITGLGGLGQYYSCRKRHDLRGQSPSHTGLRGWLHVKGGKPQEASDISYTKSL